MSFRWPSVQIPGYSLRMPLVCPNCLGRASVLVRVESARSRFVMTGTEEVTTTQSFPYCPPCGQLAQREPAIRKVRNLFLWGTFWGVVLHFTGLPGVQASQELIVDFWIQIGTVSACALALGLEVWRRRLPMPPGATVRGPAVYCDLWRESEGATYRASRREWLDALVAANPEAASAS